MAAADHREVILEANVLGYFTFLAFGKPGRTGTEINGLREIGHRLRPDVRHPELRSPVLIQALRGTRELAAIPSNSDLIDSPRIERDGIGNRNLCLVDGKRG